jgi:hypothetical protein
MGAGTPVVGRRPGGRAGLALGLGLAAAVLAGCSASPSSTDHPSTTFSVTARSVPTPAITTPTVTIAGHTYPTPTEVAGEAIDPLVATGDQIVLTDKGFVPYRLFAQLNETITWTNLSSHPVRVTFLHLPVRSGVIPVGGTFTYASKTLINFLYVSSSGYHGAVAIGAFTP